jgi:hypothetical protein
MKTFFVTIFLIFTLASLNAQIQNRTISGSEYDIKDPRNPNCPCHKLQQQAEKEYRQYQEQTASQFNIQTQNIGRNTEELKPIKSLLAQIENTGSISIQPQEQFLSKAPNESKKITAVKENKKIKVKKIRGRKNLKIKPFRHSIKSASLKNARKRVICFVW